MLDRMLEEGICERGNYAFRNEEGCAVLFAIVGDNLWLQAAYSPVNYPAWDVSTFNGTEEDLVNHITDTLGDWYIDKTQCDLNENDGVVVDADDVVQDVVEHVVKMAEKYDFDPIGSDGILESAIRDSAAQLSYLMTQKMIEECAAEIMNCYET